MKELNTLILERFTKEQQLKGRVRNADICKWAVEKGQEVGRTRNPFLICLLNVVIVR